MIKAVVAVLANKEIIAALIAGPITAAVTYLLSSGLLDHLVVGSVRRAALQGAWSGILSQLDLPPSVVPGPVHIDFKVGWRTIKGTWRNEVTVNGKPGSVEIDLRGGFLFDRYMRLEFQNRKKTVVQFGSMVFKLSDDHQQLDGRFAGYGHLSKLLVKGEIVLHRDRDH